MNEQEIIKALMENEKPFGLMSEEMQAKAKEINDEGVFWEYYVGDWIERKGRSLCPHLTYRLRPAYEQPEPKMVKWEVSLADGGLVAVSPQGIAGNLYLSECLHHPLFIGFLYEDGVITSSPRRYKYTDGTTGDLLEGDTFESILGSDRFEVLTPTAVLFKGKK